MDDAVAGRIVDPAAAKLQPFLKFGKPIESRQAFRNGKSIASTAIKQPKPHGAMHHQEKQKQRKCNIGKRDIRDIVLFGNPSVDSKVRINSREKIM